MADPSSPSASASAAEAAPSAPAPAKTATEIIHRPDPGTLARGRWEAPTWAFYVAGALIVLASLVYLGAKVGLFKRGPRKS